MDTLTNNGGKIADKLHFYNLLRDGLTLDEVAVIAAPYVFNERVLLNESFWEDFCYNAEELGYKLRY